MGSAIESEIHLNGSMPWVSEGLGGRVITPDGPMIPHYYSAVCILDWLESVQARGASWWTSQLDHARSLLESAWYKEGGSCPVVSAYIQAEVGRVEYMADNLDAAKSLLKKAKDNFISAGLGDKAAQVQDALAYLAALRQ